MIPKYFSVVAAMLVVFSTSSSSASLIADWGFDEGSGSTTEDLVGNLDGTLQGASWTTDRLDRAGKALEFGQNKWVNIANTLKPQQVTFSAWISISGTDSAASPIFSAEKGHGADGFAYRFGLDSGGRLRLEAIAPQGTTGSRYAFSSAKLLSGEWYHVAGTYDGQTVAVYVDGALAGSTTYGSVQNLNTAADIPVAIGHLEGWSVQWFRGKMDDVRVYDEALSGGQVSALVPEPSAFSLGGMVLMGWLARRRRS